MKEIRFCHHEDWGPDLHIEFFGGAAPVQAWGTIAGKRFYFRARHDEWTFAVSLHPAVDPVDVQFPGQGFLIEERYGSGNDASYLPYEQAEAIIRRCATHFRKPVSSEGVFVRQIQPVGFAARVEVCLDLTMPTQAVKVDCPIEGFLDHQGESEQASTAQFEDWKQGAITGVRYALWAYLSPSIGVTITRIQGQKASTSPTMINAAAIDAVWKALHYKPEDEEWSPLELWPLTIWKRPVDLLSTW